MSTANFPALAGLEYPVIRTPIFKNLAQQSVSGNENRAALWTYPRWKWTLSFNFLRDDANDEFQTLAGFFLARQGSYDSFLFKDVDDDSVTGQAIGTGDGSTHTFQLVRTFGGFTEPVLRPGGITMYKNGVSTSAWTPSGSGGITFTVAPAAGVAVTADFTYKWPVRFLTDEVDFSKYLNLVWEQKQLELISLKNWP